MKQINENNFYQEVIKASCDQPVLLQFKAPWCAPCHGLTRTIDQIADQHHFPVKYAGLDVDQFTDLALKFKVMGVPHTMMFVSGYAIDEFSDPLPAHELILFIKNALVLPRILKYSHYKEKINTTYLNDLEAGAPSSSRKNVYHLTLARFYFFIDLIKSQQILEKIHDQSDQFEDLLFIKDLYPLMDMEFSHEPVAKKLWAAKNALMKQNFESTYQFLIQANKIDAQNNRSELPRMTLLAFRQFLGTHHELNRKYQSQFSQVVQANE